MNHEVWTIKKVLDWAADYFEKNNIEDPHLEAEILLSHALNMKRIDLYVKFEKELDQKELSRFKEYALMRKDHMPSAYITGIRSFMSLDFVLTRYVLIPRPETELLVEAALDTAKQIDHPCILDIGTGSGNVAISIAKYAASAKVCGTDTSKSAVLVAIENAKRHGVIERVSFEAADLFPKQAVKYDMIVSNPPYIRSGDIRSLPPEIKDFEPLSALDSGPDGLDCYRKILDKAGNYLKDNGCLLFEVGIGQSGDIKKLVTDRLKIGNIQIKKDLNGIERVIIAKR